MVLLLLWSGCCIPCSVLVAGLALLIVPIRQLLFCCAKQLLSARFAVDATGSHGSCFSAGVYF